MSNIKNILLNKDSCKSIWFMRQAGRYLPEFRAIRSKNTDFIKLCLNSELSSEITLQPIKRFDLDSAIIFSDILMIPFALGQDVSFNKDNGPKLSNLDLKLLLENNEKKFTEKLNPVYKAIEITKKKLNKNKSLISFIGAPWTLLIYMLGLRKNKHELNVEKLNQNKQLIDQVLEIVIKYSCIHIKNQINAGADVVQIFDSWAGLIPINFIRDYCYIPNLKIIEFCKKEKIPNICFPKGIKSKYEEFNRIVKPDCINIDAEIDPIWAREKLSGTVIQGGMDPNVLLKDDKEILKAASKYIQTFRDIPYIFNLGHGLLPETDPVKVEKLVKFYRNFNG